MDSKSQKFVQRLQSWIKKLETEIKAARVPSTQNPTPKRVRERAIKLHKAANNERAVWAMWGLIAAYEAGTVPEELQGIRYKKDIIALVSTRSEQSGLYEYRDSFEFRDKSPAGQALQQYALAFQDPEAGKKAKIAHLEAQAILSTGGYNDFFPTPDAIIDHMVSLIYIEPGMRAGEPEAGTGRIAERLRGMGCRVEVCEINYDLRQILNLKGFETVGEDFLAYAAQHEPRYDIILMNPPFSAEIEHITAAYKMLLPGGSLVSVASNAVTFRNGKYAKFKAFVDEYGGIYDLPVNAFRESGTNVSTVLISLDK